jgi:hypothetical protein
VPVSSGFGLLENGFELIRKYVVTGASLSFNDLTGKTVKIALRTVGNGANNPF